METDQTSKSVVVTQFGGYEVLQVMPIKLPPLEGMVEVKVNYAGLNFADLYTRQGLMERKDFPFVLGMECIGSITRIDSATTNLQKGQRVICYDYTGGMYSETIRVPPEKCFPVPDHISDIEGGVIFVNYLTAYFTNFLASLRPHEKILILSCAGGVGCAITQLAKTIEGVTVYGTVSPGKEDAARINGVDHVIAKDNFQMDIQQICPGGFDVIVSNETGPMLTFLQGLLKPLGRLVVLGANNIVQDDRKFSIFALFKAWWATKTISIESLIANNRIVAGLHLGTLLEKSPEVVRNALEEIFELMKQNKLKPQIDSVHPLDNIIEATQRLAERMNVGKVLIKMD